LDVLLDIIVFITLCMLNHIRVLTTILTIILQELYVFVISRVTLSFFLVLLFPTMFYQTNFVELTANQKLAFIFSITPMTFGANVIFRNIKTPSVHLFASILLAVNSFG